MYHKHGYIKHGTKSVLDGGGAQALNAEGVYNLAKWLLNGFSGYAARLKFKNYEDGFKGIQINVLWPGGAYLEEIILLLDHVKQNYNETYRFNIYAFDIQ